MENVTKIARIYINDRVMSSPEYHGSGYSDYLAPFRRRVLHDERLRGSCSFHAQQPVDLCVARHWCDVYHHIRDQLHLLCWLPVVSQLGDEALEQHAARAWRPAAP